MARLILIIGPAQHGKSTVRKIISRLTGKKGGSCSDTIYHAWATLTGETEESVRAWPKERVRPLLVALGDWLTGGRPDKDGHRKEVENFRQNFPHHLLGNVDPELLAISGLEKPSASALIQYSLNHGVEVLDGVRREDELTEYLARSTEKSGQPIVLWVENPAWGRVTGDNFSVPEYYATHKILNTGTLEDLEEAVKYFLAATENW